MFAKCAKNVWKSATKKFEKVCQNVWKSAPKMLSENVYQKCLKKCGKNFLTKVRQIMFEKVRQKVAKVHKNCLQNCARVGCKSAKKFAKVCQNVWKSTPKNCLAKVHQKCFQNCAKVTSYSR